MKTKFVEILRVDDAGKQRVAAVCSLVEGVVDCSGDESLVALLKKDTFRYIDGHTEVSVTIDAGEPFLKALTHVFNNGYIIASPVQER